MANPHALRHCFATHQLQTEQDIRTIQSLSEHKEVTAMIFTLLMQSNRLDGQRPVAV